MLKLKLTRVAAGLVCLAAAVAPASAAVLVINEIDYDQAGTDAAEFIEIKNVGSTPVDLDPYELVLVNGATGAPYQTVNLPAVLLASGDYYVVCGNASTVANCDLDVTPDTNLIQNGAPDAVALVSGGVIIDTVSYEGDTAAPYTEGSGAGLEDDPGVEDLGISRFPDGTDTNQNNVDLSPRCISPGEANRAASAGCTELAPPTLVINEIDYDQPGTDAAEFIEIKNTGSEAVDLDPYELVLVNGAGGGASVYQTIDLPAFSLASGDYYVVCGNASTVANCDLDVSPDTNLIQNGAPDAVALVSGSVIMDTVSYEGDTAAPYTEGSGAGLEDAPGVDYLGISRFPDGADTNQNNVDLSPRCISPGEANRAASTGCTEPAPVTLVINEIDYDQAGTDTAEFIEIKNTGPAAVDLDPYTLVLVNGSGGGAAIYNSFDLPAFSLAPGDYFVICGNSANTINCDLDVTPDINLIQNGAPDAVALVAGSTIIDTVSYEGDTGAPYTEGSGAGLEDDPSVDYLGISRFPDGADTDQNNVDLSPRCITPGEANTAASAGCTQPVRSALVVNEIDYDQAGTDTAEFVEIKNVSGSPVDLGLYELRLVNGSGGGAVVYQTYPLPAGLLAPGDYYVVCGNASTVANCDLDVTPDTNLIQNGAPDAVAIALISTGSVVDTVSYEGDTGAPYTEGSGTGLEDDPSFAYLGISRFPDGADTDMNNVDLSPRCITPGGANTVFATNCTPNGPVFEIFEIQGAGLTSPFVGGVVTTEDNIVTALAPDGFFIQTPDARADASIDTSNGIFVFTGGAPAVAVGDQVDVTGTVQEFFDFTELAGGPSVSVDSSGNPLPAVVTFDATVPSPDPTAPSCAIEFECYEGMRVQVTGGAVGGPNQRFGTDPIAEVHIVAGPDRPFREPGILYPGLPGLPVWDGNPEVFELDPDKLGLPNQIIFAGSHFDAEGVIGFEFGGYELWPTSLTVYPATLPVPVSPRQHGEFTVGTLNMFRFFDDVDDPPSVNFEGGVRDDTVVSTAEFLRRRTKFVQYILGVLDAPDILAVEEVEKIENLEVLAADIAAADPAVVYTAYLVEGNDVGTIDTGFLVRDTVAVDAVTQLGYFETYINPLTGLPELLHDRPPLQLEGRYVGDGADFSIVAIAVHNRSLGSIEDPVQGPRVRAKRLAQAQSIAQKVQDLQAADPGVHLVVIGDFNAFEFTDGYVDAVGQIAGDFTPADNELSGPDLVDPNLTIETLGVPPAERYSFVFTGSAQAIDHALTSTALAALVTGFEHGRGNCDAAVDLINDDTTPLRSSDHDGAVLYVFADSDGDGVADGDDLCAGTMIPESVPTQGLNPNHYALVDGDRVFDTVTPPGGGQGDVFTLDDTAGCSCEQIIDALHLGNGHRKNGCSVGAMRNWVDSVGP